MLPQAAGRSRIGGLLAVLTGGAFAVWAGQVCALHCDETNVLRHATRFAAGDFGSPGRPGLLWLLLAPAVWLGDPVVVVRALRLVASLASIATLAAVLRLLDRRGEDGAGPEKTWLAAGPLAVLLLATSMDWQGHAFELRTDTFVTPVTLLAMHQLWRREPSLRRAALAGALIAASGLFSQKSVYNAAAIALGWAAWLLASPRPWRLLDRCKQAAVLCGVVLLCGGAWFGLLSLASERGTATVAHTFDVATRTAFGFDDLDWGYKIEQIEIAFDRAPVLWSLFALALPWALVTARRRPRVLGCAVAALAMLGTIALHRGFRIYYVASIEPYMALPAGALLCWTCSILARRAPAFVAGLPAAAALAVAVWQGLPHAGPLLATDARHQLRLMRDVREVFPDPVPYIDLLGLVPVHEEVTFLGTGHQRTLFRRSHGRQAEAALGPGAAPSLRRSARKRGEDEAFIAQARARKPLFLVREYMDRDRYLQPAERRWFWTHFLPFRPNLYLHGGRMLVGPSGSETRQAFELLAGGDCTVWLRGGWTGTAQIDGQPVLHGQIVVLEEGVHELSGRADEGSGELWVVIGKHEQATQFEHAGDQIDWSMFPRDRRDRFQQYDRRGRDQVADLRTPDHDPSMSAGDARKRAERHRRYQEKRQERDAGPRATGAAP